MVQTGEVWILRTISIGTAIFHMVFLRTVQNIYEPMYNLREYATVHTKVHEIMGMSDRLQGHVSAQGALPGRIPRDFTKVHNVQKETLPDC
jgi:hypothetical protein